MTFPPASQQYDKEILRGLTLTVVLLPLFFFPNLVDLYRLPKQTLLAFLTAVLSWLWLLGARKRDHDQTLLPFFAPISLYLLLSGLSLINALNLYEGADHFLNLVLGITLFWVTANHMDRDSASALFPWIAVGGAIVSLLGIIQAWGIDIPTLYQVAAPSSTFGNKNMAAQYILFVIPVAYYLLLASPDRVGEWLYGVVAALVTTYLIYTGTRAAWGAAAMAFLILWLCLRARDFSAQELLSFGKRKWGFLLGIVLFTVAMKTAPPYFISNFGVSPTLAQLQSMLEVEEDISAASRFALWANTLAIFLDHPALGAGKGNFQFIYPLYNERVIKDPAFSVEMKAAEAHNDYVQLLAEVGLLGTAAFFWILFNVAKQWWREAKDKFDPMILPIGFGIVALLLVAFWDFPFENPVVTAFFWIYAGLIWSLDKISLSQRKKTVPQKFTLGITIFLAVSATIASISTFMHLKAEFYHSRGSFGKYPVKTVEEKLDRTEEDFNRAIRIYPYDYRYHHWRAILLMRQKRPAEALQANLRALSLNPYNINGLNNLGIIYVALGNIPKAIQAFETALKIWPDYVGGHNRLGAIYEQLGEREKAAEQFRMSLKINPENSVARKKLAELSKESSNKTKP